MRAFRWIPLLALVLAAPQAAQGWNDTGHMLVAAIAYQRLSPQAKAEVDRLVALDADPRNETFVTAACWPDDLKGYGIRAYDEWHYTNRGFSPDGTLVPPPPKTNNVEWVLNQCIRTLKSKKAPDVEKARMLRFLLHFTGDIHQPLHCCSRYTQDRKAGDRGGNAFRLTGVGASDLHAYWDGGIGRFKKINRPLTDSGQAALSALADSITQEFPAESLPERSVQSFAKWTTEGHNLAKDFCYKIQGTTPDAAYITQARAAARKRVALAGYRLADLLNRLYP